MFGDTLRKRSMGGSLSRYNAHLFANQTSKFDSLNLKAKIQMGIKFTKETCTLRSETLLKWYFMRSGTSSVALYGGFRCNKDGSSILLGCKIGSVKLIFPLLVTSPSKITPKTKEFVYDESDQLSMLLTYTCYQLFFGWMNKRTRNKQVEEWINDVLPGLKARRVFCIKQILK